MKAFHEPGSTLDEGYEAACAAQQDVSEHLPTLRRLAEESRHVTEFGVHMGTSTTALLAARPTRLHSYDIVRLDLHVARLEAWARQEGIDFTFHLQSVLEAEIEPTVMLYIDDRHHKDHVTAELERHQAKVSKYLVFHDTVTYGWYGQENEPGTGINPAIEKFLVDHPEWKEFERYENNNGLLVLRRTS
jgi:cephalosporin hydroxylase